MSKSCPATLAITYWGLSQRPCLPTAQESSPGEYLVLDSVFRGERRGLGRVIMTDTISHMQEFLPESHLDNNLDFFLQGSTLSLMTLKKQIFQQVCEEKIIAASISISDLRRENLFEILCRLEGK
ncbi:hypothetical protein AV530_005363 [Patagioenas fasciata monilis]|uniref:Uncharacterized protein n=1 Tax=Patagioenas fasciata monilis TaxID=372326 RepID=A0A1V4JL16_PATFA|nr:hypothetical protein AV530_005363 [Patagioenas fasciata monilis]